MYFFNNKQDKYTMDPGRQIYLSNNKKMIFEQQNQKKFPEKFFFEKKI